MLLSRAFCAEYRKEEISENAMANKIVVKIAPPKVGGDAIELSNLSGKMIALICKDRDEKKTRFGQRKMTLVNIAHLESKEVLAGVMFQTYFQDLELNQWYIGKVVQVEAGNNKQWVLTTEGLDKKMVQQLVKHLETVKLEDDSAALLS